MEDAEQNKLFVGGISWDATEDVLKEHFAQYGVVLGSVIARDRISGNPRGFAFVTFSESSSVDRALEEQHQILSRTVCFLFIHFYFIFRVPLINFPFYRFGSIFLGIFFCETILSLSSSVSVKVCFFGFGLHFLNACWEHCIFPMPSCILFALLHHCYICIF